MLLLFCDMIDGSFSGTSGSFGVPVEKDDKRPALDLSDLDSYALERWEACHLCWIADLLLSQDSPRYQTILHYMVSSGSGQYPSKPSQGVLYLLQRSGLMAKIQYAHKHSVITYLVNFAQWSVTDNVVRFPVPSLLTTRTTVESLAPVFAHGRGTPTPVRLVVI